LLRWPGDLNVSSRGFLTFYPPKNMMASTTEPMHTALSADLLEAQRIYQRVGYFRIFLNRMHVDLEGEFLKDAPQVLQDWQDYFQSAKVLADRILHKLDALIERSAGSRQDRAEQARWRFESVCESLTEAVTKARQAVTFEAAEPLLRDKLLDAWMGCIVWQKFQRDEFMVPDRFRESWDQMIAAQATRRSTSTVHDAAAERLLNPLRDAHRCVKTTLSLAQTELTRLQTGPQDMDPATRRERLMASMFMKRVLAPRGKTAQAGTSLISNPLLDACMTLRQCMLATLRLFPAQDLDSSSQFPGLLPDIRETKQYLEDAKSIVSSVKEFYAAEGLQSADLELLESALHSQERRLAWIQGLFDPDSAMTDSSNDAFPIHRAAWARSAFELPENLNLLITV
jgi:hypothetical protein